VTLRTRSNALLHDRALGGASGGGSCPGPLRRSDLSLEWRAAVASVGAPEGLRVHDLRHHAVTTMARMPGVTTKELMTRIGHASYRAALIYQHATEERDRAVADWLDAQIATIDRDVEARVAQLGGTSVQPAAGWTRDGGRGGRSGRRLGYPFWPGKTSGGGGRNRTAVRGFAGPCLNHSATPPRRRASLSAGERGAASPSSSVYRTDW